MAEMERRVLQHHLDREEAAVSPLMHDEEDAARDARRLGGFSPSSLLASECFTRAIERDSKVKLGMSLREHGGCVYVQALVDRDGSRSEDGNGAATAEGADANAGPAHGAGLLPGDRLLGLNGQPFSKGGSAEEALHRVGEAIARASSPMAIHIQREGDRELVLALLNKLRTEPMTRSPPRRATAKSKLESKRQIAATKPRAPVIHPFAKALAARDLIRKGRPELVVTRQLRTFADRARQWESKLSFRLRGTDFALRPLLDARDVEPSYYTSFLDDDGECPPFFDYKGVRGVRSYAPSTPMIGDWRGEREVGEAAAPPPRVEIGMSREAGESDA